MYCSYVAENMTKCLLTRVVHLREVSVKGSSTVVSFRVGHIHAGIHSILPKRIGTTLLRKSHGFKWAISK